MYWRSVLALTTLLLSINTFVYANVDLVVLLKWENVYNHRLVPAEQQAQAIDTIATYLLENMPDVNVSITSIKNSIGITPLGHMNTLATLHLKQASASYLPQSKSVSTESTSIVGAASTLPQQNNNRRGTIQSLTASMPINLIREGKAVEELTNRITSNLDLGIGSRTTGRKLNAYEGLHGKPKVSILIDENIKLELTRTTATDKLPTTNKRFKPQRVIRYLSATTPANNDTTVLQIESSQVPWDLDRINQPYLPLDGNKALPSQFSSSSGSNPPTWVYVFDTGVLETHTEFNGRVTSAYNAFPDEPLICDEHGTHVASKIAGRTVGVDPTALIFSFKTLDCQGYTSLSDLLGAVSAATQHCTSNGGRNARGIVLNFSLGGTGNPNSNAAAPLSAQLNQIIDLCDAVVIAAAGNSDAPACNSIPAGYSQVLAVGASTSSDTFASFSNYGSCVGLFAPGVSLIGAGMANNEDLVAYSGTSVSAPLVSGAACLWMRFRPVDFGLQHPSTSVHFADNIKAQLLNKAVSIIGNLPSKDTTSRLLQITNDPINTSVVQIVVPSPPAPTPSKKSSYPSPSSTGKSSSSASVGGDISALSSSIICLVASIVVTMLF